MGQGIWIRKSAGCWRKGIKMRDFFLFFLFFSDAE